MPQSRNLKDGPAANSYALVALWIVVVCLAALLVGAAAGWLSWLDDRRVARAVLVGGSAAGGAVALAVAAAALFT
ncbi:hypothetical protein F8271_04280 [Micromonospora sp. ALFpr18c]|nr:hypothetical protein F8271_04280 [Micromonospora sp. ALFpr18c]